MKRLSTLVKRWRLMSRTVGEPPGIHTDQTPPARHEGTPLDQAAAVAETNVAMVAGR